MKNQETAMHHVFLVIVLSLHVGFSLSHKSSDSFSQNGSHNLLKLEKSNNSVQRPVRCTPCEDSNLKKPLSNHLEPDFRGNGADNLGYDWSSMAWGGLAFPRRSKFYMGGMPGRGGRMMPPDWGRSQGNVRVVCDTCRTYWDGNAVGGRDGGRQFDGRGGRDFYGGEPGYWQRDKMRLGDEYETRVMSPTVGVLVKPGSRIAYIPSRSGEMYWDGVSGGGTRWDGFSNGISWVGGGSGGPEWDRSDSGARDDKAGYGSGSVRPGGEYPGSANSFGSWDGMKRPTSWSDGRGRGYYFTNGVPNDIDPQWRDRGYASNWHYGLTNQNGWNGNNMKWNYGGKQWADNDRAANRFYFNTPQDRNYRPADGRHQQYGNQYPTYQSSGGYPLSFRPQPSWPPSGGYRPNDRFPASFPQENSGSGDNDKPWDYTSRNPSGPARPGPRPEWLRPGPSYPAPGNFEGSSGRFPPNYGGYDKFSPSDRNDFEKPWGRPSGYGPLKPSPSGTFPYGGNRYPEEGGDRPSFSVGGGHLFIPNDDNRQPAYSNLDSGGNRPTYPTGNRKPAEYPGNQVGIYPGDGSRPYPDDRRPSIIYTGGRPSGGESPSGSYLGSGTSGSYPGGGSTPGYPSTESSVGGSGPYPGGNRPGPAYPGSSSGYPGGENSYPSGISRPGGYPTGGSYPEGGRPGSYPGSGGRPDKYGGGDSGYPGNSGSSYTRPGSYPAAGGSSYPGGNTRPGSYPDEGYPQAGYFAGTRPTGYPIIGRPGGYPGESRPDEYPSGSRPSYPIRGPPPYPGPGGSGGVYPQGSKNPQKGYYMGFITELTPDDGQSQYGGKNPNYFGSNYPGNFNPGKDRDKYFYGGSYPNRPPSGDKGGYPAYSEDRYSGGGGGSYPVRDKNSGYDRGSEKFYYGQSGGKGKYPGGYPSNHRHPGGGSEVDFDRNQGSGNDKNSWNYGENERKDGIYRRSGGSYPPYRGGQYYTSSYLASMPTTSGSTQAGTEPKTQTVTKADEVTQSTLESS